MAVIIKGIDRPYHCLRKKSYFTNEKDNVCPFKTERGCMFIEPEGKSWNYYYKQCPLTYLPDQEVGYPNYVRGVPRGKWLDDGPERVDAEGVSYRKKKCSHCGYTFPMSSDASYPNFCQSCGADMKEWISFRKMDEWDRQQLEYDGTFDELENK